MSAARTIAALTALQYAAREAAAAQRQADKARAKRDAMIRSNIEAGLPRTLIADATGLSRAQVYKIRDQQPVLPFTD